MRDYNKEQEVAALRSQARGIHKHAEAEERTANALERIATVLEAACSARGCSEPETKEDV